MHKYSNSQQKLGWLDHMNSHSPKLDINKIVPIEKDTSKFNLTLQICYIKQIEVRLVLFNGKISSQN